MTAWIKTTVSACVLFIAGCSDDMQLLDEEQVLYGGCHNVYQILVKGEPQPLIRADAVFTTDTQDSHYLTLASGDDGLEVDITRCDLDSIQMFDQPREMVEGPAGRVVGKLIR